MTTAFKRLFPAHGMRKSEGQSWLFFIGAWAIFMTAIFASKNAEAKGYRIGAAAAQIQSERIEESSSQTTSVQRSLGFGLAAGYAFAVGGSNDESSNKPSQAIGFGLSFDSGRGVVSSNDFSSYALGAFVSGYVENWSTIVRFIGLAEQKSNSGTVETQYRDGHGISISLQWTPWWPQGESRALGIGPSLTWERISFDRSRVGSLPESSTGRTVETLRPGVAALFYF